MWAEDIKNFLWSNLADKLYREYPDSFDHVLGYCFESLKNIIMSIDFLVIFMGKFFLNFYCTIVFIFSYVSIVVV